MSAVILPSIMILLRKLANSQEMDSFATGLRRQWMALFKRLLSELPRPLAILDVGGTQLFWETVGFTEEPDVRIVLLDLSMPHTSHPIFSAVVGDGADLSRFCDSEFDVVFSNSVIEHLGSFQQQRKMAHEVRRVGVRYFVQTPNRFFPLEPHFLFPFFQFLPLRWRLALVQRFDLGWYARNGIPDRDQAMEVVSSIRLLSAPELRELFPHAEIYRERLCGVTKSFIAYGGWKEDESRR